MKFKEIDQNLNVTFFSKISSIFRFNLFRNFKFKRILLFLLLLTLFISIFTAGVIAQRNYGFSNFVAKPIVLDAPGIFKRKALSFFSNPQKLILDLKFEDHMKLMFNRENAVKNGTTRGVENEWISAKIGDENKSFKGKVRLKGAIANQHLTGEKWSFRVKLKNQKNIFGMNEFALMSPVRRNYLGQWFIRKTYEKEGLITRKYELINLIINGENKGIYVLDERYNKVMLERNQRKEGPVIKFDAVPHFADEVPYSPENFDNYFLISDITAFDLDKLLEDDILKNNFFKAKDLMEKFRLGQLKTHEVFDIELLAKWIAVADIMGAWHGFSYTNMRFYFNPITSKFEPVPDDDFNERSFNYTDDSRLFRLNDQYNDSIFLRNLFSDQLFLSEYMSQLVRISSEEYIDNLFIEFKNEINKLSNILSIDYPLYNFLLDSKQNIYDNAKSLRKELNPYKAVQGHFRGIKDDKVIEIAIANNHSIPIEILFITNTKSEIYSPLPGKTLILEGRGFGQPITHNLFQFELPTDLENSNPEPLDLKVIYRVLGTKKLFTTEIFPYPEFDSTLKINDFIRENHNVHDFPFLEWDKENNEISFKFGNWEISEDLIIPPNQKLTISEGVNLDLINSAMILSYSPVLILGTKDNQIEIVSSDHTGQGITVLQAKKQSLINHARFNGLSKPNKNGFKLSGSINFYQSPVHFENVLFANNIVGDDYLNIIRTKFSMDNSSILNSFSDAIDIDFSNGTINNSVFSYCGFGNNNGDCIDLSGSIVFLNNISVDKAADKGISIGEKSQVSITNSSIQDSNIAIASKDLSETTIQNLNIKSSKIGISAFQKKPEFGPSSVFIDEINFDQVDKEYSIEKSSSLIINSNSSNQF